MKFNGQSSVVVHPHTNLEELKTVTSISLFMRVDPDKDPIEDRFILYLGDRNVRKTGLVAVKSDKSNPGTCEEHLDKYNKLTNLK